MNKKYTKTKEQIENSLRNIWWRKGEEHPKGMLGKHHSKETIMKIKRNNPGNTGQKHSEEAKKKMSEKKKGKYLGKNNPMYGKHHSKETKIKISKRNSGINSPMFGKENKWGHHSKETKIKIGLANKGKVMTKESKKKISLANKGRKCSEKTRQKMREARAKRIFQKKDSSIEIKIQNFLKQLHIEFLTHYYLSNILHKYRGDIFIPKQDTEGIIINQKTVIECDGCYWHGCQICKPKKYSWTEKRINLDKLRTEELIEKGFRVLRLWEHKIKPMKLNEFKEKL